MKRKLSLLLILFLLLFGVVGCGPEKNEPSGTIRVIVVNYEKEEVFNNLIDFYEDNTLLGLLQAHDEIQLDGEEQSYGFYIIKMCGISAKDYSETYWKIEVNGNYSLVGIAEIPLKDKDEIKFLLINW
ncbi:MAG: DUF4430 domain-containing protein [Bacilli bacterium]|nr:DUF4430 domain-containing protein [Bacilli bacterium]MDD4077173.1 DUF4430 domain-containing protein [Bacilli bacterium]MDD4387894.1 DUF4430 domain-containing protein [Bacilli bacterium]